jgi:hypothetical protein
MNTKLIIAGIIGLAISTTVSVKAAEELQTFVSKPGACKVRIEGTSSVHDWRMESPLIGGSLQVGPGFPTEPGQEAKPGKIEAKGMAFTTATSLKSLKEDGKPYMDSMNKVAYEHLNSDKFPHIRYQLEELVLKEAPKSKDGAYVCDSKGKLAVAGKTNSVSMPVNITPLGNKTVRIQGNTTLKMTDYGITPPSPSGLGLLIKTGDDVKLIFDWTVYQKSAPVAK